MTNLHKKYLNKYGAFLVVTLALLVFVYQLHAQEVVSPPEVPPETTTETPPATTTEGTETETPPEGEGGGVLGNLIDFVEENVFGSENPENENPPPPEEPQIEPVIPEEIIEEPVIEIEGKLIPAPFFENKNALPLRGEVNISKNSIDYTGGSYTCSVSPFSVDISHTSATTKVLINNINQTGQQSKLLQVGELPRGFNITFANKEFSQKITSNITEFSISIEKNVNSQKGSFTIPVIYSVGEKNVVCQVNIINH